MSKIVIIFSLFTCLLFSQTRITDEYEYYTPEVNFDGFGYLKSDLNLPFGTVAINGIRYTRDYNLSRLGKIPVSTNQQISFYLEGAFRIGIGTGSNSFPNPPENFTNDLKYYLVTLDVFSMSVSSRYTFVLDNGYAIFASLGLNLINVGGTMTLMEKGVIKNNSVATINLIPFAFSPSIFFDFGNTGFGISAYFNSSNLLSYVIAPDALFGDDKGIKSGENVIGKVEFKLIFVF